MNKAVFLDRDGTIIVDKNYLSDPDQIEFLYGAVEGLRAIQAAGYLLIVVTNQSGIARGYFTKKTAWKVNDKFQEMLAEQGVTINRVYVCPHLKEGIVEPYNVECECRKPGLALFRRAIADFDLDISECAACGDKPRDVERLPELGIPKNRLWLIKTGGGPGFCKNLLDFAGKLISEDKKGTI